MDTQSLTFPEEWRFVRIHVDLRHQAKVGHGVGLHGLEGTMFCYILNGFFTQVFAQEI